MKQQVSGFWSLSKIPGIVNTITDNVEVGVGGGKTLDVGTLYSYAKLVYGLPSGNFQQVQIQGITGYNELAAPEVVDQRRCRHLPQSGRGGAREGGHRGARPQAEARHRAAALRGHDRGLQRERDRGRGG